MKQVYPQVRPRRLGTRGNSRYCYAGLKKRLKLEEPVTPECGGTGGKLMKVNNVDCEQEMNEASSFLIREWAGKLLTAKFGNLRELALFLIDKMFVDNRSSAAHTVISSMSKQTDGRFLWVENCSEMSHIFLALFHRKACQIDGMNKTKVNKAIILTNFSENYFGS